MIRIRNQQRKIKVNLPRIERTIKKILKVLIVPFDTELSLLLVNDKKMKELNYQYRGINKVTDVLSFPVNKKGYRYLYPEILGDVVISMPAVIRQSKERGVTLYEELTDLLIHSILHLLGYNHESASTAGRMRRKEKEIASSLRSSQ